MSTKKESWYGPLWVEYFIAFIGARLIQSFWLPDVGMVFLLPIVWVALHFTVGGWIAKMGEINVFGGDKK